MFGELKSGWSVECGAVDLVRPFFGLSSSFGVAGGGVPGCVFFGCVGGDVARDLLRVLPGEVLLDRQGEGPSLGTILGIVSDLGLGASCFGYYVGPDDVDERFIAEGFQFFFECDNDFLGLGDEQKWDVILERVPELTSLDFPDELCVEKVDRGCCVLCRWE